MILLRDINLFKRANFSDGFESRGIGFVIEAVTNKQILVTASKVRGTGFVIEAVTNETTNQPINQLTNQLI